LVSRDEAALECSEFTGCNGASRLRHEPQVKVKILERKHTQRQHFSSAEEMAQAAFENTCRLFRIPEVG
jgi:hypothetical protein